MKKLISLLIVFCMVLSCTAVAAYAKEKEDYSDMFFEHMKEYIEMNEYHQGLVKSSYELLGDTSNGYHIAYCEYYWGDNVDLDFSEYRHYTNGDYIIVGDGYPNKASGFGIYCFNEKECVTLESAFDNKTVPLDEAAQILNKYWSIYVYRRGDKIDDNSRYRDEVIGVYFNEYINKDVTGFRKYSNCKVCDRYSKYYIFFGSEEDCSTSFISRVIDNYVVVSPNIYEPYDLGIYAFDGEKVYTLEEAINAKLFKMSDIADMIEAKPLIIMGEVTGDGKVDMEDVVFLQKKLAFLYPDETTEQSEYNKFSADIDKNGEINMYDIVLIQRIIAKL